MSFQLKRILIVAESGSPVLSDLAQYLPESRFGLHFEDNVEAARDYLKAEGLPHLMIVSLDMPDSWDLCQNSFQEEGMPVITTCGQSCQADVAVRALTCSDDFIRLPHASPGEMAQRIQRVLSRVINFNYRGHRTSITDWLEVDLDHCKCWVHGQEQSLTPIERDLLRLLFDNAGKALSGAELIKGIWGKDKADASGYNALRVYMHRLRSKLEEEPEQPQVLLSVRGIGYRFEVATGKE